MIAAIKNNPPKLSFGFGKTKKTVTANTSVTVWLSGQYNEQNYTYNLVAEGCSTKQSLSNYQHKLTYITPGSYTISAVLKATANQKDLTSNILTLTVV
ncbi:hypothetical protein GCM10007424_25060 [Flavobacterium suaedae]|uniref:PKD domain-containing protein n=1 Tax=Flavobacterium suaedae TaxID=1767027 RepID=A0ABQ1K1C4_9FLAO|nr:hypothetical protein [Flavobacterium suaedae]GGB84045.1 hypothetical protein GCM10007424_25060 [Flavobacterium suaedae]